MTPSKPFRGMLLACIAAVSVAMLSGPAAAGPKAGPPGLRKGARIPPAYGTHCPPGLAKKGSCIPPGHRKHWAAGDIIPRDIAYRRVHYRDYSLPRPQPGHIYANIGGDVYLMAEATRRVIEAINLVDAATR
jgi:hypothetical protein